MDPLSVGLLIGKSMNIIASVWRSVQYQTSIKIRITNLLNGGLEFPQWYSSHGHAAVLPPPVISQGGEIAEIQFDKTVG